MRDKLLNFIKKELIGPDPTAPYIQENGEEVIVIGTPRTRYSAGILYPQGVTYEKDEKSHNDEDGNKNTADVEESVVSDHVTKDELSRGIKTDTDSNDEIINLSNAYLPSAMGISCFIDIPDNGIKIKIKAGRYTRGKFVYKETEEKENEVSGYLRESLESDILLKKDDLPSIKEPQRKILIEKNNIKTGLELHIVNRSRNLKLNSNGQIYTFSLVNGVTGEIDSNEVTSCFYQVGFEVESVNNKPCFLPYPDFKKSNDEEYGSNKLLYWNKKTFAIGHGCSPTWTDCDIGACSKICAEVIPTYEMKPILPYQSSSLNLKMFDMSDSGKSETILNNLQQLCDEYELWIEKQEKFIDEEIDDQLKNTAKKHIYNCKFCLKRMKEGVDLIEKDSTVKKAFTYMNKAMLMQQLHYGLKTREWITTEDKKIKIDKCEMPNISDPQTWPDKGSKLGSWYPFQLAFILMNLTSLAESDSDYRKMVDVIWFPTGGGKTEAYLGLSAFTIFLRKIRNPQDDGTAILMRYTLRLLTAQQFQRAASMICACDYIRKQDERILGNKRISIGLWVGDDFSPNNRDQAVRKFKDMLKNEREQYPFIIYKCPWCGAGMGPVKEGNKIRNPVCIKGYSISRNPSTVIFKCDDPDCLFSSREYCLPLLVIDDDIYDNPPTLIIGTVDKFAMVVWKPEGIRRIFGFRNDGRIKPPELIIQDELHLISGPLGSMVGHYETLIDELCKQEVNGKEIRAKIIASTATVSRAKEQVNALYNCGKENVFLFPPQAINSGDSFFAKEDRNKKGRLYVGIHAAGLTHATAHIRVTAALLQGIRSVDGTDEERNYYWTLLDYFNSLRELGHAVTRIYAEVPEYLSIMWQRMGLSNKDTPDIRRFINNPIELTSRVESGKISQALKELEVNYPAIGKIPVDICLATNMISVGVDVPRLGLMTVTGQPKATSEYIQATSRVGRSSAGPGMVVVVYNTSKPRDRSHYERFYSYHSKIYSFVEPTSVTPFSSPVRERALHAILVGLVRYFGNSENMRSPQSVPSNLLLNKIIEIVKKRVEGIDKSEMDQTILFLKERIHHWSKLRPTNYGNQFPNWEESILIYPSSIKPPEDEDDQAWSTPTSMRNVDPNCNANISRFYMESDQNLE